MSAMQERLPVLERVEQIRSALQTAGAAVLVAPPGTGKTTGVPPELLSEPWLGSQKILVLEPRRLAARMAATRMAKTHDEPVGRTFGYSVRGSSKRSSETLVEVVTEGLFLRRLQNDPTLDGVGAVLFDEFHERSLDSDLGLALLLDTRAALRPDLRILVMSATIEAEPVARLIGAPIVSAEARLYQVETRYRPGSIHVPLHERVRDVVAEALRADEGDILVFLPGRPEIRRTRRALEAAGIATSSDTPSGPRVVELHGSLSIDEQQQAISADPRGRRRVVLSTSLAETSITVAGVRVVVDAGRRRTLSVDAGSGLPSLVTVPVSLAGADQRRGRAGRTAPGVAYRLWAESDNRHRPVADTPEICRSDLATLVLQLRTWGVADPSDLSWLDAPPPAALKLADELLAQLHAVNPSGGLTKRGRLLAEIGFHPRLASVIAEGILRSTGDLAAEIAAVLETARSGEIDVTERVRSLRNSRREQVSDELKQSLRQWRKSVTELESTRAGFAVGTDAPEKTTGVGPAATRRRQKVLGSSADQAQDVSGLDTSVAALMLAAFPDRVARRRTSDRADDRGRKRHVFHLRSGGEAFVADGHQLGKYRWIVAAELDAASGALHLGCGLPDELVHSALADDFATEESVEWNRRERSLEATVRTRLGQISFDPRPLKNPSPESLRVALLDALADSGPAVFGRLDEATRLRARVALVRSNSNPEDWPDFSDVALTESLPGWLGDRIDRLRTAADLDRLDIRATLLDQLTWHRRSRLDELTPPEWTLANGRRVRLRYGEVNGDPATVLASVKLRDVIGTDEHPTVMDGKVRVVVELLSPAGRPVQRTTDLPGFWRGSYASVRSELRGRYPKHPWPEEPWKPLPKRR